MNLPRRLAAEFVGTSFLLAIIVGSGIMAERLAGENGAVALLGNTLAIATGLFTLILSFVSVSGAHFNPAVTLTETLSRRLKPGEGVSYLAAQLAGAIFGVIIANLMFDLQAIQSSAKVRTGAAQWFSEFVATFGLLFFIAAAGRVKSVFAIPLTVAAYIFAACWFTASTSFANPAVTIARCLSDTFTGIRPVDAPMFVVSQIAGGIAGWLVSRWLLKSEPPA